MLKVDRAETTRHSQLSFAEIETTLYDIFDTMPDGVILIDESGAIQFFNAGAEKLFGYQRDDVLGQNVKLLMPPPDRNAHDQYLANYMQTGIPKIIGVGREVVARRKDGTDFPIYLSIGEIRFDQTRRFVGVTHDLSNIKRVERKLLTLSSAVDQSPTAVLIANRRGVIEYVNDAFMRLTGYDACELIGRTPNMLHAGHAPDDQYRGLWRAILAGEAWRGEIEDRRKDGGCYCARQTITPLLDAAGEVTHYLAIQEDITALKREQKALVESEERFRHVAELTGEWLWEQDQDGRYVYSSAAVVDILGFGPDEILGRNYVDLQSHDAGDTARRRVNSSHERRPFFRLVNQYRHKNGSVVFTESSGAPMFNRFGRIRGWRGVDHDITAHKTFEDALRLRNRAMESLHVGVAICDARKAGAPNIYVNPALCRITGYSREELIGRNTDILRGPETDIRTITRIREAQQRGQDYEATLKSYRKSGAPFWNELFVAPVADDNGEITHYVEIHTDVTERRKAEENRQQLEIAKRIQLSLLPEAPLRCGDVEVAGRCVPASHVGGDYFDFFSNSATVDVAIADVSGHSVGAALMMAEVRGALRLEARRSDRTGTTPGQVLQKLNELLYEDLTKAESFITMFFVKYHPETRLLRYANAGHNPPLLFRARDRLCLPLDADGVILGALQSVEFEERSVALDAGDALLLYTDGVVEARNAAGEFFGLDRLQTSFRHAHALRPEDVVARLFADLRNFCGDRALDDDVAIVTMRAR